MTVQDLYMWCLQGDNELCFSWCHVF